MTAGNGDHRYVPPAGGPLWPGPRLLVPITLDALLIGDEDRGSDRSPAIVTPDYNALGIYGDVLPGPLQSRSPYPAGVHLHWTMPGGLRHGQQLQDGSVRFPYLPNRWLVTRFHYDAAKPGAAPSVACWVIESDYLGQDGTVEYPSPSDPYTPTRLGRNRPLGEWSETRAETAQFLTVKGPGDTSFSAVYYSSRDVLSFFDKPDDTPGTLTYAVMGWNANYPDDSLFGKADYGDTGWSTAAEWQSLMAASNWQVPDPAAATAAWTAWLDAHPQDKNPPGADKLNPKQLVLPAQVLAHGMLIHIGWQGVKGQSYPPTVPQQPELAIGETGIGALSAWMAQKVVNQMHAGDPRELEQLLMSISYDNTSGFSDDSWAFEDRLQRERFQIADGGKIWVVERRRQDVASGTIDGGGDDTIPLDASASGLLTDLNAAQAEFDRKGEELAALRWEMFAAYWKKQVLGPFGHDDIRKDLDAALSRLGTAIDNAVGARSQAQATIDAKRSALDAYLENQLNGDFLLAGDRGQPFSHPNNPVILVAGVNRDTKHDEPTGTGGPAALKTRFTGQTMTAIAVSDEINGQTLKATIAGADILAALGPPSAGSGLPPKEMADLWVENILLDTGAASLLAMLFFRKVGHSPSTAELEALAKNIAVQQSAVWSSVLVPGLPAEAIAEAVDLTGTPPAKIAVEAHEQPWDPLFVDWHVTWYPTDGDPAGALAGWTLGTFDFSWDSSRSIGPQTADYAGRTVIGEKLPEVFSKKLQGFVDKSPAMAKLPDYQQQQLRRAAQIIGTFDLVAQSLDGFNNRLIMRRSQIIGPVTDETVRAKVGAPAGIIPIPGALNEPPGFSPIRAGHFEINDLWVVDAFGQIFKVVTQPGKALPIRSIPVMTEGPDRKTFVQLAPRFSQNCRVDLVQLSARDESVVSNSADSTTPIDGWVMSNHLDRALMMFLTDGTLQGEMIQLQNTSGSASRWDPAPGRDVPFGAPPAFPGHRYLEGIAQGILQCELNGIRALADLIAIIDSVLVRGETLSDRDGGNLAVLVGRPLAVVRASLSLQLDGGPVYDQAWAQSNRQNTHGFTAVPFPVRIGDLAIPRNGVIGFFVNDDFTKFYPATGASVATAAFAETLRASPAHAARAVAALAAGASNGLAGASDYVVKDPLLHIPADGTVTRLTLIVDPRGEIPVVSGAMPSLAQTLRPGPVAEAFENIKVTFRMGPLLTDPEQVRMPLPAEIRGSWSWIERSGVTVWHEEEDIDAQGQTPVLGDRPPVLREGWLKLSGAFGRRQIGRA